MTANQYISIVLLVGRLVTVFIMIYVMRKQWGFLRSKQHPELNPLRRNLFIGSAIILAGNIVPITIDTLGIFNIGSFGLLLAYVFSNNITAMLSAYMIYSNLKLTEKTRLADIADDVEAERLDHLK